MRIFAIKLTSLSLLAFGLLAISATASAAVKHSSRLRKSTHSNVRHTPAAPAMDSGRATQIQTALIRKGYLSGEPSGIWDQQTISAMQRLQSDNGWQSRLTPDARALIKLGLGPTQETASATSSGSTTPR